MLLVAGYMYNVNGAPLERPGEAWMNGEDIVEQMKEVENGEGFPLLRSHPPDDFYFHTGDVEAALARLVRQFKARMIGRVIGMSLISSDGRVKFVAEIDPQKREFFDEIQNGGIKTVSPTIVMPKYGRTRFSEVTLTNRPRTPDTELFDAKEMDLPPGMHLIPEWGIRVQTNRKLPLSSVIDQEILGLLHSKADASVTSNTNKSIPEPNELLRDPETPSSDPPTTNQKQKQKQKQNQKQQIQPESTTQSALQADCPTQSQDIMNSNNQGQNQGQAPASHENNSQQQQQQQQQQNNTTSQMSSPSSPATNNNSSTPSSSSSSSSSSASSYPSSSSSASPPQPGFDADRNMPWINNSGSGASAPAPNVAWSMIHPSWLAPASSFNMQPQGNNNNNNASRPSTNEAPRNTPQSSPASSSSSDMDVIVERALASAFAKQQQLQLQQQQQQSPGLGGQDLDALIKRHLDARLNESGFKRQFSDRNLESQSNDASKRGASDNMDTDASDAETQEKPAKRAAKASGQDTMTQADLDEIAQKILKTEGMQQVFNNFSQLQAEMKKDRDSTAEEAVEQAKIIYDLTPQKLYELVPQIKEHRERHERAKRLLNGGLSENVNSMVRYAQDNGASFNDEHLIDSSQDPYETEQEKQIRWVANILRRIGISNSLGEQPFKGACRNHNETLDIMVNPERIRSMVNSNSKGIPKASSYDDHSDEFSKIVPLVFD